MVHVRHAGEPGKSPGKKLLKREKKRGGKKIKSRGRLQKSLCDGPLADNMQ